MAAFDPTATLRAIESFLATRPELGHVQVGEPKSPPPGGKIGASLFMDSMSVVAVTVGGQPVEMHTVMVRLYSIDAFLGDSPDDWELQLSRAVGQVLAAFWGDFDLGGTIRNIDIAGEEGTPMGVQWGHIDVGGSMFRLAEITVPCKVDSSVTATQ